MEAALGPKNLSRDRRHYLSRVYKELFEKNQKRKANLAAREIQIAHYVFEGNHQIRRVLY